MTRFLFIWGIVFNSSRMLVGAVASLYLLSRGLLVADIAYLKGFQAIVILLVDIPFGYFADRYSKKFSVFLGIFFGSLWMALTAYSPTVSWLYAGEFFNALSLSFFNGAFQALLIETYKKENKDSDLKKLMGNYGKYNFFCMSLAVLVGGIYITVDSNFFWWIGSGAMLICAFSLLILLPKDQLSLPKRKIHQDFSVLFQYFSIPRYPVLMGYLCISLIGGIFYQIFIQYWQVIVSFVEPVEDAFFFSLIFFMILMGQSVAGEIVKKIEKLNAGICNLLILITFPIMFAGMFYKNIYILLFSIVVFFLFYRAMALFISAGTNEILEDQVRATYLSIESSIMRICLFLIFPLIGIAINLWGLIFLSVLGGMIFLLSLPVIVKIKGLA